MDNSIPIDGSTIAIVTFIVTNIIAGWKAWIAHQEKMLHMRLKAEAEMRAQQAESCLAVTVQGVEEAEKARAAAKAAKAAKNGGPALSDSQETLVGKIKAIDPNEDCEADCEEECEDPEWMTKTFIADVAKAAGIEEVLNRVVKEVTEGKGDVSKATRQLSRKELQDRMLKSE
jgi:hypothetical protein